MFNTVICCQVMNIVCDGVRWFACHMLVVRRRVVLRGYILTTIGSGGEDGV